MHEAASNIGPRSLKFDIVEVIHMSLKRSWHVNLKILWFEQLQVGMLENFLVEITYQRLNLGSAYPNFGL